MELSLFKGFVDTLPESITLDVLVAMMRTDESVRDYTEKHRYYRGMGNVSSAKYYKNRMPCFGVAARFAGGKRKEHITALTGMSLVDIDHIAPDQMSEVLEKVRADEHTLLAYTTLSGLGVRVIVRYRMETRGGDTDITESKPLSSSTSSFYKHAFLQINTYYSRLTGQDTDLQCKNVGRLSTIAHDAALYYNPNAVPFVIKEEEKRPVGRPKQVERSKMTVERCEGIVLRELAQRGVVYGLGTHNKYISDACYMMNRYGVSEEECTAWALNKFCDYQDEGNDVPAIVRSCYQQAAEHGTAQLPQRNASVPYATVEQIQHYLTGHGIHIRHNMVTRKEEIRVESEKMIDERKHP